MRDRNKRIFITHRAAAAGLAAVMAAGLAANGVLAAEPQISMDESVYINLDYYGVVKDASIVKGCDLNGNSSFVDYGQYEKVVNMSNHAEPKLEGDRVTWELESGTGRFYYECTPKNIDGLLPWDIDVSYSLNGVPSKAADLAGASGLIQVDIDVKPNGAARDYYKNNMMLVAAAMVDLEDVKSFRADGAQMQVVGSQKAALFMAMPGEETTFSYQVGTDSFESYGTIFLLVPITMAQLDEIQNIKDIKERIEDASDSLNNSLDIVLGSLAALPAGLQKTQEGLDTLDKAREALFDTEQGLYDRIDSVNSAMAGLNTTLRRLASKLNDIEREDDGLEHISDELLSSSKAMTKAADGLGKLNSALSSLQKALGRLEKAQAMPDGTDEEKVAKRDAIIAATESAGKALAAVKSAQEALSGSGYSSADIQDQLGDLPQRLGELASQLPTGADPGLVSDVREETQSALDSLNSLNGSITGMSLVGENLVDSLRDLTDRLDESGVVKATSRMLGSTAQLVNELRNTSMYVEEVMKDCLYQFNDGAAQVTEGVNQSIDTMIGGLNQTGQIQNYKNIIKDTIKNEWDRLEDEYGIWDIDINAEKMSFTSEKNPVPDSIQIIMRTEEISIDDEDGDAPLDMEPQETDQGIKYRVEQVFVRIKNKVSSWFGK